MSAALLITVEATEKGVSIQSIPLRDGNELELAIAKTLDVGLRATQEYIAVELSKATGEEASVIEGKNVHVAIGSHLRSIDAFDPRVALRKMGFKLKGD